MKKIKPDFGYLKIIKTLIKINKKSKLFSSVIINN